MGRAPNLRFDTLTKGRTLHARVSETSIRAVPGSGILGVAECVKLLQNFVLDVKVWVCGCGTRDLFFCSDGTIQVSCTELMD